MMQLIQKTWSKKFFAIAVICALLVVTVSNGNAFGAASSSTTSTTTRVSVHDPSIYYDSSTSQYYVYGSHLAQASSTDLRNWSYLGTQGYTNTSLYAASTYEGYYYIKNKNSGLYLDVVAGSAADGANIQQWGYNGSNAQKFRIKYYGNEDYYLLTANSTYNSAIDVTNGSSANGANIIQWTYSGGTMQLFKIQQNDDGTVAFLTKASGYTAALDVADGSTANGANVQQWAYLGGDMQKWELVKADGTGNASRSTATALNNALAPSFAWAGYNDQDSSGGYSVWAPAPIYNASYVWADGSTGAYMLYYCTSSTYIRSAIGFAVSKSITGPFEYVDTIVYSGFTNASNTITTTSSLGTKTVNTWYRHTNIPELIDNGTISGTRSSWFTSNGGFNNTLFPNAIDPALVYDTSGKLWMTYGSWSGGLYILEINLATGKPYYPGSDNGSTDRYFGKRIAGGYGKSGEAPYIVHDSRTGYYYLYVTYGWLGNSGGYHIRLYRSTSINGTYTDAAGNSAEYASSSINQSNYGIKLFGNYNFSGLPIGYKSGGHNSAFVDTDGMRYLVYHTRFDNGTEGHEVRVHQQFMNADKWPVTAVYEYLGSSISSTGYSMSDMAGTYEFVNMGLDASTSNVGMLTTGSVTLNSGGTITGSATGTWSYTSGTYHCTMVIGGVTYKGVFFKQRNELSSHTAVMTFTLIGSNNQSIWGSK
ncbi:RICIN domain-containing protein [Paenibacillus harenae]|uniref:Arabinan endo-1,5-alpha-L-arabinosidase n=1 Tax=Paenibacillus harenae TaxID=306543 RepID=A0ABT9UAX5_PAEHA|nr:RICIN domain-containing protein [Paenibacillus harenae]MDQ0116794.1 arabinan endo-1,5-alpha-L-arabinosidase [Paenibacillus harenae]